MGNILDLLGTSKKTFKLGKTGFNIDGSAATANRALTLPDAAVDLSTGTTGWVLTKQAGGGAAYAAAGGGGSMDYFPVYNAAFAYSVNQYVIFSGIMYRCIQAGTGQTPNISSAFWQRESDDRYYGSTVDLSGAGDIYGNVYCMGDLTVSTGQTIWGNVLVLGNLMTNHINGGGVFAIQGHLFCYNRVQFYGNNDVSGVILSVSDSAFILNGADMYGGNATGNNNGGQGGGINCSGNLSLGSNFAGWGGNGAGTGQGGLGGYIQTGLGFLNVNGSINNYAGSNGGLSTSGGSDGGNVQGQGIYVSNNIDSHGGSGSGTSSSGGRGGNITCDGGDLLVGNTINIYGGNAGGAGDGGRGGTIATKGDINVSGGINCYGGQGGTSASGNGGQGGQITCYGSITAGNSIQINGADGYAGGSSGNLTVNGDATVSGIIFHGGNSLGNGNTGATAGVITVKGSLISTNQILGSGGNADPNGGTGGASGQLLIGGNFSCNNSVIMNAGNSAGVVAGIIPRTHTINGNVILYSSTFRSNGGNAGTLAGKGGTGGQLNVYGSAYIHTLELNGGTANGTREAGCCGSAWIAGGLTSRQVNLLDGTSGTASTGGATLNIGGSCLISAWNIANRGGVWVRPYDFSIPLTLKLSSASGKQTLTKNSGGTQTNVFVDLNKHMLFYDAAGEWYEWEGNVW